MLWAVLCLKHNTNILCISYKAGAVNIFKCDKVLLRYLPSTPPFPMTIGVYTEENLCGWEMLLILSGNGVFWLIPDCMTLTFLSLCKTVEFIGLEIIKLTLNTHFLLVFPELFFSVNAKFIGLSKQKLSYTCNPLVALNPVNPTSNHKQWINCLLVYFTEF